MLRVRGSPADLPLTSHVPQLLLMTDVFLASMCPPEKQQVLILPESEAKNRFPNVNLDVRTMASPVL